nr:hypothetical protein [Acinetobacter pittii]
MPRAKGLFRAKVSYNLKRPHSSLDKMTPNEFYYDQLPQQNKVA